MKSASLASLVFLSLDELLLHKSSTPIGISEKALSCFIPRFSLESDAMLSEFSKISIYKVVIKVLPQLVLP